MFEIAALHPSPLPHPHGPGKADADAAAAALKEARSSSDDRCRSNVPLVIQEAINSEPGCGQTIWLPLALSAGCAIWGCAEKRGRLRFLGRSSLAADFVHQCTAGLEWGDYRLSASHNLQFCMPGGNCDIAYLPLALPPLPGVNTGQSIPIDKIKTFAQNFATAMDDVVSCLASNACWACPQQLPAPAPVLLWSASCGHCCWWAGRVRFSAHHTPGPPLCAGRASMHYCRRERRGRPRHSRNILLHRHGLIGQDCGWYQTGLDRTIHRLSIKSAQSTGCP